MAMFKKEISHCKCERCGHIWPTRGAVVPIVCPKCKSPYWNKPKKETAK